MAQEDSAPPAVDYSKPLPSRRELRRREEEARRANRRGLFGRRKAAPSSTPVDAERSAVDEPEFVVAEPASPEPGPAADPDSTANSAEAPSAIVAAAPAAAGEPSAPAEAPSSDAASAPAAVVEAEPSSELPAAADAPEAEAEAPEPSAESGRPEPSEPSPAVEDAESSASDADAESGAPEPTRAEPAHERDSESDGDHSADADDVSDADGEPAESPEPASAEAAESDARDADLDEAPPAAEAADDADEPNDADQLSEADEPSDADDDRDAVSAAAHDAAKTGEPTPQTAGIPVGHGLVTPTPAAARAAQKDYGRAGRNLPAAIGVGLLLGGGVLASLLLYPPSFLVIVVVGIGASMWELANALSRSGSLVSRVPTVTAALCMVLATYFGGREALWVAFAAGAGTVVLFTLIEKRGNAVKDVCLSLFALTYVGLMASFVVYMLTLERGNLLVVLFLALVVSSDIGGYAVGVLFGKHPIAPRISPKKSWEGFVGSAVLATAVGVCMAIFVFGAPVWTAVVLGVVVPAFATLGDFSESMIKRDLDLKDMGTLLPGHGGVMDRLDSILPTAPVVLLLLSFLPGYIAAPA